MLIETLDTSERVRFKERVSIVQMIRKREKEKRKWLCESMCVHMSGFGLS